MVSTTNIFHKNVYTMKTDFCEQYTMWLIAIKQQLHQANYIIILFFKSQKYLIRYILNCMVQDCIKSSFAQFLFAGHADDTILITKKHNYYAECNLFCCFVVCLLYFFIQCLVFRLMHSKSEIRNKLYGKKKYFCNFRRKINNTLYKLRSSNNLKLCLRTLATH